MSCEHVRPTIHRSGTLLMTGEMRHIKLKDSLFPEVFIRFKSIFK